MEIALMAQDTICDTAFSTMTKSTADDANPIAMTTLRLIAMSYIVAASKLMKLRWLKDV